MRGKQTPLQQRNRQALGLPDSPELPDDQEQAIIVRDKSGEILLTYWQDGDEEFHRDGDRPAVMWADGTNEWYQHGTRHRVNGPAVLRTNGEAQTWIKGKRHS